MKSSGSNWSQKLRLENAALHEVLRALTDDELKLVRERIKADETAHLKTEADEIVKKHLSARSIL